MDPTQLSHRWTQIRQAQAEAICVLSVPICGSQFVQLRLAWHIHFSVPHFFVPSFFGCGSRPLQLYPLRPQRSLRFNSFVESMRL
jgi:hypothetical protein